jgi:4-hydroxybenzoate polyprenyltransferase
LSVRAAITVLLVLYSLIACGCALLPRAAPIVLAYIGLNVAHTFIFKAQPVIDIFSIAFGFVLRVHAGARVIEVPVSAWMFVTTLCLALYLASVKRRQEMNWVNGTGRRVLAQYTTALLDRFAMLAATGALVFYSLFVMASRPALVATIPLVLFGLFRYAWLVEVRGAGESPAEPLFNDWQLAATVALWAGLCSWVLLSDAQ